MSSKNPKLSLRLKLTGLFCLLFGVLLTLFSTAIYRQFKDFQQNEFDSSLHNYAIDLVDGIDFNFFGEVAVDPRLIDDAEANKLLPFSLGKALIVIRRLDGRVLAKSAALRQNDLPIDETEVQAVTRGLESLRTLPKTWVADPVLKRSTYRMLTHIQRRPEWPHPLLIQIAAPQTFLETESRGLLRFLFFGIPLMILASAFIGSFFVRRALKPVTNLIRETETLSAQSLSARLPVPSHRDEFQDLTMSLNSMLTRLETAFHSQERFVADASHQLKTPLAIMHGELESLLREASLDAEARARVESAKQEVLHLSRLTEDLLLLTRVDAGAAQMDAKPIRIDEVLWTQLARLRPLAERREVSLKVDLDPKLIEASSALTVRGDEELLGALVFNLIDNAIKYSPSEGIVSVQITEHRLGQARLTVRDSGPGIPPEDQVRVFERFFRSRSRVHGGSGVGLAIAKRVADLFHIRIELESELGKGTSFHLYFDGASAGATTKA
jgi:signal transduction histidine kinase